jgi:serine/threonine protein kinase
MTPSHIGSFEVKHVLGSGGFGTVYAAVDPDLGRWVAIKALRNEVSSNPAIIERFRTEGISLSRLNHTNITILYGMPRFNNQVYLVMELVNGQPLDAILSRLQRLDLRTVRAIVAQASAGLGYAHRMNVIHRDIKPSNLMLGDNGILKIMDFGIARIRGTQRLTRSGLLGTYAYLAPEQFRGGEGSERSDLYSLACVVFEALTGSIPFDAPTEAEMMRGHLETPVRPLRELVSSIDSRVDRAVQRALAKNPDDRFESVEAFAEAIGALEFEREAPEIIRELVDRRAPPPVRPTLYTPLPSETDAPGVSYTDFIRPDASPQRKSTLASTTVLLASVAALAAAGFGYFIFFSGQGSRTDSVKSATGSDIVSSTLPRQTTSAQSGNETASGKSEAGGTIHTAPLSNADSGAFVRVRPTGSTPSSFITSPGTRSLQSMTYQELRESGQSPDALITEAKRRFQTGESSQVNDALLLLRYVADTYRDPGAFAEMGRIYDPSYSGRPAGMEPDLSRAAQYYRAAVLGGDKSAENDRNALEKLLRERSQGAGEAATGASAILYRFWRQ